MKSRLGTLILGACAFAALAGSLLADTFAQQVDAANEAMKGGEYIRAIVTFNTALLQAVTPARQATVYLNRGEAYWHNGEPERAIKDWSEAIRVEPTNGHAYHNRATAYYLRGEYKKAIPDYQQTIALLPALGLNGLAWVLATCPDASLRDGRQAVEHAKKSCDLSNWNDWRYIDTLAAAYAEIGDFERAIGYVKQAMNAPGMTEPERAELREHLDFFTKGRPYREGPGR
jgi:tetratricopeptide (TPR) repeat protein